MASTGGGPGARGGLFIHPVMVRMAPQEMLFLDFLSQERGKARGTIVRELVEDGLAVLMCKGTPLRAKYDERQAHNRRPTPIERAVNRAGRRQDNITVIHPPAEDTTTS